MTEIIIVIIFYLSVLVILLNILYLIIKLGYLIIREYLKKEYKSKTKIIKTIVKRLIFGLSLIMIFLIWNEAQKRSFYCLDDDKCVTVWKKNGEVYIIPGRYKSYKLPPPDDYIIISNFSRDHIGVIFTEKKLLIHADDKANIMVQSSNDLIELYGDNKKLNDSLYIYFDGTYRKYKRNVDFIIINIKENYAVDKHGKNL